MWVCVCVDVDVDVDVCAFVTKLLVHSMVFTILPSLKRRS